MFTYGFCAADPISDFVFCVAISESERSLVPKWGSKLEADVMFRRNSRLMKWRMNGTGCYYL
jgi:hypothetical protein